MIKILHTADLHLGVETYGKTDAGGINSRILDYLVMLDELVENAISQNYDVFLIAGDVFENERPKNFVVSEFSKRIRTLLDAGVAVVITPGNHETTSSVRVPSVLETIKALEPTSHTGINIACHVLGRQPEFPGDTETLGDISIIDTKSGKLQILAMPYPRRSELLTASELKNSKRDEGKNLASKRFLDRINELSDSAESKLPSIFVGHFGLKEAHMQPGRMGYLAEDVVLSLYDLIIALDDGDAKFSYIALGHYHNPQMPTTNLSPSITSENLDGEEDSRLGIIPCQAWEKDFSESILKPDDSLFDERKKPVRLIKTAYSGSPGRKDFTDGSRVRNFIELNVDSDTSWGRCRKLTKSRQLRQLTLQKPENYKEELEEKFFSSNFWSDIYVAGTNSETPEETEEKIGFPLPIFRLKIPESARREWDLIKFWLVSLNMFQRVLVYIIPDEKKVSRGEIIPTSESPVSAISKYIDNLDDDFSKKNKGKILELAQEILVRAGGD